MLKSRILTGVLLAVIMTAIVLLSHIPLVLELTIILLNLCAIYELFNAVKLKNKGIWYSIFCVIVPLAAFTKISVYPYITAVMFILAIILFAYLFANINKLQKISTPVAITVAFMIVCFFNSIKYIHQLEKGVYLLGGAIILSVITDSAAYFVGKGLGKHKLASLISPNKTIEGSIGGALCGSLIVILTAVIMQGCKIFNVNILATIIYVLTASVICQFGDLAMSSIKRICSIKDYSHMLKGHGGILDRFDSHLFVLPYTYIFCCLFQPILF